MSLYNLSYVLMKDRLLTKKNVCLSCPWIDISKQLNILENASLSKLCNGTNSLFWHEIWLICSTFQHLYQVTSLPNGSGFHYWEDSH